MLGPAAVQQQPHSLSGLRTCLLVGLVSGLWCQALCVSLHVQTHTHIPLTHYRGADTLTSLALHWWHIITIFFPHIALFSSCCFTKRIVTPPHTCAHAFLFHITELFLMIATYRVCCVFLNITRSMIDVYGNEEVTSSKEIPYGWEQHTDERHLQKALVNSWHA